MGRTLVRRVLVFRVRTGAFRRFVLLELNPIVVLSLRFYEQRHLPILRLLLLLLILGVELLARGSLCVHQNLLLIGSMFIDQITDVNRRLGVGDHLSVRLVHVQYILVLFRWL